MNPSTITFTGLEVDAADLRSGRKWQGAWPSSWTRYQFTVRDHYSDPLMPFDRWMAENIQGRWGSYAVSLTPGEHIICVAFELLNEAVMFRLKDGDTAWRGDEPDH